jgi:hypothetical protein
MTTSKMASTVVLVLGIGLLVVSLLADFIGVGDDPGFGRQQTLGTIAGVIVSGIGLFLTLKSK